MNAALSVQTTKILEEHLFIANEIAVNLKRKYPWCTKEDIYSYSLWGLTMASLLYDKSMSNSFAVYARAKGYFLAVDEMRKDRLVVKKSYADSAYVSNKRVSDDVVDYHQAKAGNHLETTDEVAFLLEQLCESDREIIRMHYAEGLNFRQIGFRQCRSESAVCVRHRAILNKLRILMSQKNHNTAERKSDAKALELVG